MEAQKNNVSGQWISGDNMFAGQWVNRNNGQRITISNSMIDENNEMILITSIGEMSMDELSRNYIQDTESGDQIIDNNVTPASPENYLLPEDQDLLNQKVQYKPQSQPSFIEQKPVSKYQDVLDKFFGENKSSLLNLKIDFDFNIDELKTLMKYIDLNTDDIAEYVFDNMINKEKIKKEIDKIINNKFKTKNNKNI